MFSFSKKIKTKEGVVVVFDIGSASVGGALVFLSKSKKPKILYSTRKQMSVQNSLDIKKFKIAMLRALKSTVSDLEKKGFIHLNFLKIQNKKIEEAFCFLSSPWNISHTKIMETIKEDSFVISKELIESYIRKEEKKFLNSNSDSVNKNVNRELMDKKIIQFKLNGYRVDNPFRKKAQRIETSLFLSVADKNILDKIEDTIGKVFHLSKLHMHSFTLASFLSLRDIFKFEEDFVFLDVSGEVTDLSFVKDGIIKETQTFPIGRNFFIREILKSFGCTSKIAISMLKAYGEGELDEPTQLKFQKVLIKVQKKWGNYFEDGMLELSNGSILPKNIFILSDDDISNVLKEIIELEKFTKLVFPGYSKVVNPILINSDKIKSFCRFEEKNKKDIFLGIETVFINRIFDTI